MRWGAHRHGADLGPLPVGGVFQRALTSGEPTPPSLRVTRTAERGRRAAVPPDHQLSHGGRPWASIMRGVLTKGTAVALILAAEDDPDTRNLVARILERAGHDVIGVADGESALREIRQHRPDLVLSDVDMPLVNGFL